VKEKDTEEKQVRKRSAMFREGRLTGNGEVFKFRPTIKQPPGATDVIQDVERYNQEADIPNQGAGIV
jgi:hypothetical protein